jgi:hypothetical protein
MCALEALGSSPSLIGVGQTMQKSDGSDRISDRTNSLLSGMERGPHATSPLCKKEGFPANEKSFLSLCLSRSHPSASSQMIQWLHLQEAYFCVYV